MRPNYFIFMGYLTQTRENQQSEHPHLCTYEPPFPKILDLPLNIPQANQYNRDELSILLCKLLWSGVHEKISDVNDVKR